MPLNAMTLSTVIITLNEEKNITECLQSAFFSDEVIVVDSGSTDLTVSLAESMGAKIFKKDFQDFASQKNFGMDHATGDWILLIDADERVTPALAKEIRKTLEEPKAEGYFVIRRNNIFGRWMRFGINRSDRQLRLIRKSMARFEGFVHERILFNGKTVNLKNPMLHFSTQTIADYMKKLMLYSRLEAKIWEKSEKKIRAGEIVFRPLWVFCSNFFVKLGVLDGLEGFLFSVLSAYNEFVSLSRRLEPGLKNGVIS